MLSLLVLRGESPGAAAVPDERVSLTAGYRWNYIWPMNSLDEAGRDLERLENQLKKLLDQVRQLREENQSLQTRQEALVAERASLVARNDEARSKVEAMIHRLKALEQT